MAKKKTPKPKYTITDAVDRIVKRLFRGRMRPEHVAEWHEYLVKFLTYRLVTEGGMTPEEIDAEYRHMVRCGWPLTRGDVKRLAKLERYEGGTKERTT